MNPIYKFYILNLEKAMVSRCLSSEDDKHEEELTFQPN